jgi:hypothetical protein
MAQTSEQLNTRLQWIQTQRARAEQRELRIRRTNERAIYVSLFAGSAATAIAGFAAAAATSPIGPWRVTCGVVALLTFLATVSAGLQRHLDLSGNLGKLTTCLGKLRALEFAVSMGTRPVSEIDAECEEIVRQFPEFVA